jgi:hypothetical protein
MGLGSRAEEGKGKGFVVKKDCVVTLFTLFKNLDFKFCALVSVTTVAL